MSGNKQVARSNKHGLARNISEEIKREVRKRCGFGCVICGVGIYEYEHFNPDFKSALTHNADGITLLCPNHHAKKTSGKLSLETIAEWNNNPKALRQGFANEKFDLRTSSPIITLGAAKFILTPILLQIEDEPILSITPSNSEDEPFFLSATLRGKDGEILLSIEDNEWKTPSDQWDCKNVGNKIEIRSAQGQIELIIRQDPPDRISIERLVMVHRGCKIEAIEKNGITITSASGGKFSAPSMIVKNFNIGVLFTHDGGIAVGCYPREGGGSISPGTPGDFVSFPQK